MPEPDPDPTYEGDDQPEGSGPIGPAPPDILVCLACGDGTYDPDEHYCPEDCPSPQR